MGGGAREAALGPSLGSPPTLAWLCCATCSRNFRCMPCSPPPASPGPLHSDYHLWCSDVMFGPISSVHLGCSLSSFSPAQLRCSDETLWSTLLRRMQAMFCSVTRVWTQPSVVSDALAQDFLWSVHFRNGRIPSPTRRRSPRSRKAATERSAGGDRESFVYCQGEMPVILCFDDFSFFLMTLTPAGWGSIFFSGGLSTVMRIWTQFPVIFHRPCALHCHLFILPFVAFKLIGHFLNMARSLHN